MKDFAKKYLDWYNGLDKVVKIILCLLWDIPSNLCRLAKSAQKESVLGIVFAIVVMIFGGWLLCVIDIVSLALKDKVFWIDDLNLENTNCDNNCSCCSDASDCDKKVDDQTKNNYHFSKKSKHAHSRLFFYSTLQGVSV